MNELFAAIKLATIVGNIKWKRTDEVVDGMRGYTSQYKDFTLTTVVRRKGRNGIGFGLRIGYHGKYRTLTSDPKILQGQATYSHQEFFLLVSYVQVESEKRNLDGLLSQELARGFL